MKTRPTHYLLILIAVIFSPRLVAQEERFDAAYRSIVKEYTLNADGSTDFRYAKVQQLLTYRAFQNLYGETFVVYHPEYQKLKINECYTVMAGGKKIPTPENAFNEVLPGAAAGAPAYQPLREMVITHTGLEKNAVIHLDYSIHTAPGVYPALMGNELLAETEPVNSLEIRVRIPAGEKLHYLLFNSTLNPVETTEGNFRVFTWKMTDITAILPEEMQPGINERYPRLIFSTSGDRAKVFNFLTRQPAFSLAVTPSMQKEVNTLAEEKKSRFEIALKLQEMVVNDLKLYPIPIRQALYTCRTPEQTWNSMGGTSIEKAVLLTTLLKAAGMNAQVVGIVRTTFDDESIASLAGLEDFAVRLEDRERGTWYFSVASLNPVNLGLTLPGRSFVTLAAGVKPAAVKVEEPEQTVKIQGNFLVSSDPKLTGEMSIYYSGSMYPLAGIVRDPKRMKNSVTGGLIGKDTADRKVSTINNGNGFQTYIVKSDQPFRKDSSWYIFTLPVSTAGIDAWGVKTLSVKREKPFEIPARANESYDWTLTLPAGYRLLTPPKKTAIDNKAGKFGWEVTSEGNKVTVKKQVKFNDRVFEDDLFTDFKQLMDAWNNPWNRQIILVKE